MFRWVTSLIDQLVVYWPRFSDSYKDACFFIYINCDNAVSLRPLGAELWRFCSVCVAWPCGLTCDQSCCPWVLVLVSRRLETSYHRSWSWSCRLSLWSWSWILRSWSWSWSWNKVLTQDPIQKPWTVDFLSTLHILYRIDQKPNNDTGCSFRHFSCSSFDRFACFQVRDGCLNCNITTWLNGLVVELWVLILVLKLAVLVLVLDVLVLVLVL